MLTDGFAGADDKYQRSRLKSPHERIIVALVDGLFQHEIFWSPAVIIRRRENMIQANDLGYRPISKHALCRQ